MQVPRAWDGSKVPLGLAAGGLTGLVLWSARRRTPVNVDLHPLFRDYRHRTETPRYIVLHHSSTSTREGTVRALKSSGYSTNFEVDADGTVYQYLDPATHEAFHSGRANKYSIGIDVTHKSGAPWPPAQVQATRKLVLYLMRKFDIKRVLAPERCGRWAGAEERCLRDMSAEDVVDKGYGLVRHRNIVATACPEDFPMGELVRPMDTWLLAASGAMLAASGWLALRARR